MRKSILIVIILPILFLMGTRQAFLFYASYRANNIIEAAKTSNTQSTEKEELLALNTWVSLLYSQKQESSKPINNKLLFILNKLSPYLSNHRIPALFRIPTGSINFITSDKLGIGKGLCDSAARTLIYLLNGAGYQAKQLNMFNASSGGHSAVEVILRNQKKVLMDAYLRGIAHYKGRFIGAQTLKTLTKKGHKLSELFIGHGGNVNLLSFYRKFPSTDFGIQNEGMFVHLELPYSDGKIKSYQLSQQNGFLFYLGSRYDRSWVRKIKVHEDIRLDFILHEHPKSKLVNSNIEATIKDKTVSWELKKGSTLILFDNKTPLSLISKNNYQVVSIIRITPLNRHL